MARKSASDKAREAAAAGTAPKASTPIKAAAAADKSATPPSREKRIADEMKREEAQQAANPEDTKETPSDSIDEARDAEATKSDDVAALVAERDADVAAAEGLAGPAGHAASLAAFNAATTGERPRDPTESGSIQPVESGPRGRAFDATKPGERPNDPAESGSVTTPGVTDAMHHPLDFPEEVKQETPFGSDPDDLATGDDDGTDVTEPSEPETTTKATFLGEKGEDHAHAGPGVAKTITLIVPESNKGYEDLVTVGRTYTLHRGVPTFIESEHASWLEGHPAYDIEVAST